ncbi:hypothetical protein CPB83DRAFT_481794 [Crepidotus variabilis]|uniref:Uncharacterized protein n=1 Tax=Crepidotus variabilis TaxID=179855 RepID=A0A9P6ER30_9AGAR|nr:hypothetical protein CPB83DRAFT_481794 [Crepidotus variabilis]
MPRLLYSTTSESLPCITTSFHSIICSIAHLLFRAIVFLVTLGNLNSSTPEKASTRIHIRRKISIRKDLKFTAG